MSKSGKAVLYRPGASTIWCGGTYEDFPGQWWRGASHRGKDRPAGAHNTAKKSAQLFWGLKSRGSKMFMEVCKVFMV